MRVHNNAENHTDIFAIECEGVRVRGCEETYECTRLKKLRTNNCPTRVYTYHCRFNIRQFSGLANCNITSSIVLLVHSNYTILVFQVYF